MTKSPRETAGFLSKLLFCWLTKILYVGSTRDLELEDVYDVLPDDKSRNLGNTLQHRWNEELANSSHTFQKLNEHEEQEHNNQNYNQRRRPRLVRPLIRVFGLEYGLLGFVAFFDECVIKIAQPILLGYLIRYFGGEFSVTEGYLFATGVIFSSAWYVVQHHPYFFGLQHVGMRSRVAVSSLVYRKALRLSVAAIRNTTIGQLVNFLSNDVNRFDQAPLMMWYLLVGPVQLAIVTYILWGYYSYYCLVGIAFFILFVPFQSLMGHLFGEMRLKVAGKTDKRIRIMNEIVSAIRVIKMYTWEEPFAKLVQDAREDEVKSLRHVANLKVLNYSVFYVSSKVVIFLTLLVYVLTGNYLTAEQVFVTMALYNNVRTVLTLFFPYGMSYLAELLISIRRLENFLLLEERDDGGSSHLTDETVNLSHDFETNSLDLSKADKTRKNKINLSVNNLYAKWYPEFDEWTLENVSLNVKEGQLVAVIGTVGSSKSSLLQAILGELPSMSGDINVSGNLAYAAQEPWIFSGSIRQNILFGKPFDFRWYERVLDACALTRDLNLLPHGDASLVGDRGISLSGGQKARINLARAVYANRDVYLLDDPLSAVDAEVGKHLFDKCIRGILRKKAVILVTHQLQFLKPANEIILFNAGRIEIQGSYPKLLQSGINFAKLLQTQDTSTPPPPLPIGRRSELRKSPSDTGLSSRLASIEMNLLGEYSAPVTEFEDDIENTMSFSMSNSLSHQQDTQWKSRAQIPGSTLLKSSMDKQYGTFGTDTALKPIGYEEVRSSGGISFNLYWQYIKAGSNWCWLTILIITAIFTQICLTGSDVWLQFWTQIEESHKLNNGNTVSEISNANGNTTDSNDKSWISVMYDAIVEDRNVQIGIYTGIIITLFLVSFTRTVTFIHICLRSSISLHRTLFQGVLRSPMRFFELNPVGRILNRFARDVGMIDEYLPLTLFDTWEIPFQGLGIFVVVSLMSPILIIPALILLVVFYKVRKYYLYSARSLKRLESVTRSPVFTHLSASIHGLTTIRALNVQHEFAIEFDKFQDTHSACWYLFLASSRWVGIVLDWVSITYIAIVTYSFMLSNLDGSEVGLAVSSALTLTGLFQWGVRQSAEAENQMVSVERVLEYSELQPEPPLESSPGMKPPKTWPSRGDIKMQNLFLRYGDDEPVLKDITIRIHPNEKVGIVGRTGAGKSSIISTLFRMVDPCSGTLHIDDVNIVSIGLHDLRSKISIIPQDPVLFLGSIRRNLDPFAEFTDTDLWSVLEDVNLKNSLQEMTTGLDSQISEGGSNFSVGERQLICLARAILRQNKILVLDEATANVDPETDALIQKTIRIKFRDCTVLTVAHRLHTVMDSNRILVLDAGRVMEFDTPYTLLQNTEGTLYQLTQQTGKATADALFQVAKRAFESQRQSTSSNVGTDDPFCTVDLTPFAIGDEAEAESDQFDDTEPLLMK